MDNQLDNLTDAQDVQPDGDATPVIQDAPATPDGTPGATPSGGQDGGTQGVAPYTLEELQNLDPDDYDSRRVPPELKPAAKALEALINKKSERLSRQERDYQDRLARLEQAQTGPGQGQKGPRNLFEAYIQDPDNVMGRINQNVIALEQSGDFEGAQRLRDAKVDLVEQGRRYSEEMHRTNNVAIQTDAVIRSRIPDYDARQPELVKTAKEDFGLTDQEIYQLSNLGMGHLAAKVTFAINKYYDLKNGGKGLAAKARPAKPAKVETGGTGFKGKPTNSATLLAKFKTTNDPEDWATYKASLRAETGG